jgi:pentatricopeptide repeat protein
VIAGEVNPDPECNPREDVENRAKCAALEGLGRVLHGAQDFYAHSNWADEADPTRAASPDGLRGSEGTFSLCTFAYVDALARAGRVEESRRAFEKMLTYANHVGLFSEEIALNGEQIGNFPQAFTHLALIDAAITLDAALDAG